MGRVIKVADVLVRPRPIEPEAKKAAELLARTQAEILEMRRHARRSVIELSVRIAEKIVGNTVLEHPEFLNGIYEQAVSSVPDTPDGTLFVHPLDRNPSRVDSLVSGRGFQVVEDASVGRGGVRVAAGGVSVDASLDSVLAAIRDALLEFVDD